MKTSYLFILMFVLSSQVALAAVCDDTALKNEISELKTENALLNSSYASLLQKCDNLSFSYEGLQKEHERIKDERDQFEAKYLNTSLGNLTIGEFIVYMDNIENHYNSINQSITTQFNQMIQVRNWTIGINIALSLAVLSLTIIFFKQANKLFTKIPRLRR